MAATEELKVVITAETEKAKAQIKGVQSQLKGIGKFASGATSTVSRAITKTLSGVKKSIKTGLKVIATMTGITMAAMIRSVFKMSGGSREWTKAINGLKASWLGMKKTMSSILQAVMMPFIKNMDKFIQKARIAAKSFAAVFDLELVESTNAAISKNMAGFDEINTISTEGGKESDKQILSDEEVKNAEEFGTKWGDKIKKLIDDAKGKVEDIKKKVDGIVDDVAKIAASVAAIETAKIGSNIAATLGPILGGTIFGGIFGQAKKEGFGFFESIRQAISITGQYAGDAIKGVGKTIGGITKSFGVWGIVIAAAVAGIILLYQNSEEFRNGVAEFINILKELWGWLQPQLAELWQAIKDMWASIKPALQAFWEAAKPILEVIGWIVGTVILVALGTAATLLTGLISIITNIFELVVKYFKMIFDYIKKIGDVWKGIFTGDFGGAWESFKSIFNFKQNWKAAGFANGGFPSTGSLFVAREAGPEMVGTIGGATAVANNDQITNGIANAVYNAIVKAGGMGGGNANITLELDGEKIGKSVVNYNNNIVRRTGRSPLMA